MTVQHAIEFTMTVAFLLYLGAFATRRNLDLHIGMAVLGFAFDMLATGLMVWMQRESEISFWQLSAMIKVHIVLSVFALFAFFVQAALGYKLQQYEIGKWRHYRKLHIRWAKYVFIPTWLCAYGSGFLLFR